MSDYKQVGEISVRLSGKKGSLESKWLNPDAHRHKIIAVLGHPHSLHGGTMNNKVVTSMAKAFHGFGIPSLRFNFRGVGESEGVFDHGLGESDDMLCVIDQLSMEFPDYEILLAGFSFGAYVTYRVACQLPHTLLISVAPAVNHGDFLEFDAVPTPWVVICAGNDEIVAKKDIIDWHRQVEPSPMLEIFDDSSHFFHGQLVELKKTVHDILQRCLD